MEVIPSGPAFPLDPSDHDQPTKFLTDPLAERDLDPEEEEGRATLQGLLNLLRSTISKDREWALNPRMGG